MSTMDPILQRVLSRAFESVCDEMGSAMIRTAVSAVFVEARDFSCAILDDRAELVAAANFDPSHLSAMPLTAEYALMELGWENLSEGDVIVVNDAYRGGGHLTDICVIRPIFVEGELFGLAMNRGHHIDVGGMAVSGFPGTARSIFHEGIRIPPVKWFEAGEERRQVMDLILLNVRFPRQQLGDFRGQLSSCITAERRIAELVRRHGAATIREAMAATKDHSERLMRAAIAEIPNGTYRFSDVMDDDGVGNGPYEINVAITIDGDEAAVDFAGTSHQAEGPINSSYGNTVGSVFNSFLHVLGGELSFNQGCFRPLRFSIPRGCFLNPIPPAPVFGGVTETSIRVIDAVSGALAEVVPDKVSAGSYGTCMNVAGGGWDPRRSQDFGFYFFQEGGWGATSWRDGWTSVPNPTSNFNDYPAETIESDLPLRCVEVSLNENSAGPGERRGGFGTRRTYEVLADECELSAVCERFIVRPHGLQGGQAGAGNQLLIRRSDDDRFRSFDDAFGTVSPSKFASLRLRRGDRFSMITGGGGGHGPPVARPPAAVAKDVRLRLIDVESARREYGVVVDEAGVVDSSATEEARENFTAGSVRSERDPCIVSPVANVGREAEDVARVERIFTSVRTRIDEHPCMTACPKQGDPVRCPFFHDFADHFWDSNSVEAWSSRNCLIYQGES